MREQAHPVLTFEVKVLKSKRALERLDFFLDSKNFEMLNAFEVGKIMLVSSFLAEVVDLFIEMENSATVTLLFSQWIDVGNFLFKRHSGRFSKNADSSTSRKRVQWLRSVCRSLLINIHHLRWSRENSLR